MEVYNNKEMISLSQLVYLNINQQQIHSLMIYTKK